MSFLNTTYSRFLTFDGIFGLILTRHTNFTYSCKDYGNTTFMAMCDDEVQRRWVDPKQFLTPYALQGPFTPNQASANSASKERSVTKIAFKTYDDQIVCLEKAGRRYVLKPKSRHFLGPRIENWLNCLFEVEAF